jgi:hypothetical protein
VSDRVIDYSRYRVAAAIAERYAAGEDPLDIAGDYFGETYFGHVLDPLGIWIVELIVAAHDRKDKYAGVTR